jgi:DNA (cytosine-5)-methyltransferase 1
VLDLFSGIGGFSLGLERTGGFRTVAFCEIDPYCRQVLKRHWPEVPCYDDIRALTAARLAADGIGGAVADAESNGRTERRAQADALRDCAHGEWQRQPSGSGIDVVCGGFPCQDISTAGKGAGITGERSGLWVEMCRVIGEVRPRYAIVENVAALLGRGLDQVLGDLAEIGYDAEWHCIPAAAVGAPHRRDRIWIVAYPQSQRERSGQGSRFNGGWGQQLEGAGQGRDLVHGSQEMAHPARFQPGREEQRAVGERAGQGGQSSDVANAAFELFDGTRKPGSRWWAEFADSGRWLVEPPVGRVAHGVPRRVDRLRALGNAVVPQIPELIGRAILELHPQA